MYYEDIKNLVLWCDKFLQNSSQILVRFAVNNLIIPVLLVLATGIYLLDPLILIYYVVFSK